MAAKGTSARKTGSRKRPQYQLMRVKRRRETGNETG
jgi:hypothetical protein